MFSISFRKYRDEKKENNLLALIIKVYILFAHAIITSAARASSVFPSSYRNTIFNQSARIFLGLFSKLHCSNLISEWRDIKTMI